MLLSKTIFFKNLFGIYIIELIFLFLSNIMNNLLDNINLNLENILNNDIPNKIISNINLKNKIKSYILKYLKKNPNEFSKNMQQSNNKILEIYKNLNNDNFLNDNIKNTKNNIRYIKNKLNTIKNKQIGGNKINSKNINDIINNNLKIINEYHDKNKLYIEKNKFNLNDLLNKTKQYKIIIDNPIFYLDDSIIESNNDISFKNEKENYLNFKNKYINYLNKSIKKLI